MKVIVCGGRDFADPTTLYATLSTLHAETPFSLLIHGGARGADRMANAWSLHTGVPRTAFYANWSEYGKAAGPMRNQMMLDQGKPDLVVAFPGGRGTADMIRKAEKAGVRVHRVAESRL